MKPSRRFRFFLSLVALAFAAALALSTAAVSAASGTGTVYVLQGLTGVTADVAVDGASVARGIPSNTVVGPLHLAAGHHVVTLTSAGTRLVSASVGVTPQASVDVLAYWAAETPKLARIVALRNDLSPVGRGKTRVVITHGIAAPPADIRVNGKVLFHSVANGESVSVLVPAGTYTVTAVATVGGATLLPQAALRVKAGTLTRAVAIGRPGTAPGVLVHVLPVPVSGAGRPSAVHTGTGGQAAGLFGGPASALAGLPRLPFALLSAALLLFAVSLAASASRHPR